MKAIKANTKSGNGLSPVQRVQAVTMEEYLHDLYECNKRRMTFKQAFSALGMVDKNKPFKQLNDEETFSALANWAIHKLPIYQSMILRGKDNGAIYQTVIRNCRRQLRVGKLVRVTGPGGTAYDWPEETKYESLDVSIIESSVYRANVINVERGYDLSVVERTQQAQEQADDLVLSEANSPPQEEQNDEEYEEERFQPEEERAVDVTWNIPRIAMRQTDRNCWEVVLTEAERELINEFLDI